MLCIVTHLTVGSDVIASLFLVFNLDKIGEYSNFGENSLLSTVYRLLVRCISSNISFQLLIALISKAIFFLGGKGGEEASWAGLPPLLGHRVKGV